MQFQTDLVEDSRANALRDLVEMQESVLGHASLGPSFRERTLPHPPLLGMYVYNDRFWLHVSLFFVVSCAFQCLAFIPESAPYDDPYSLLPYSSTTCSRTNISRHPRLRLPDRKFSVWRVRCCVSQTSRILLLVAFVIIVSFFFLPDHYT